jgi:hypothetical protein
MHFPAVVLTSRARALLATLLFLVAWLFGNGALIIGLNGGADMFGVSGFAAASALWWASYKISRSANGRGMTLGVVALTVWMLSLLGALVSAFRHYVADIFFWASTAIFLVLVTAVALSKAMPGCPKVSPSPD